MVEHGGTIQGGHYIARVRVPVNHIPATVATKSHGTIDADEMESGLLEGPTSPAEPFSESCDFDFRTRREYNLAVCEGQWYYISDSNVKKSTEADVLKSQAYVLFYEKIPFL